MKWDYFSAMYPDLTYEINVSHQLDNVMAFHGHYESELKNVDGGA